MTQDIEKLRAALKPMDELLAVRRVLKYCLDKHTDKNGFVMTGSENGGKAASARALLPLETSHPGVFAVGDIRAGSTKRVAAAVGEGAAVVAQIHRVLAAE